MAADREELLAAYAPLRVADVRDGLDALGLHAIGSLHPSIRPLWRTRAVGLARTARYLPYRGAVPHLSPDEYDAWSGWYYGHVCTYPWLKTLEPGDFVVLDLSGVDAGLMGSENTMSGLRAGAVGYVSSAGVRDTDEIILQRVPFWSAFCAQSMVQGRIQFEAMDTLVAVGGVTVAPGDVVVADGDGVIVVPAEHALQVAAIAGRVLNADKLARRHHYEALGRPLDETVR